MFPSPETFFPLACKLERLIFLKNAITRPNIIVGDYTFYDDENDVNNFEKNVKYHYEFVGDKLVIGKFCQIAEGTTFMMNGIFHQQNLSTFPFAVFDENIAKNHPESTNFPFKGDTVIGNDVWFGYKSTVMPGVKIGDGAIIGAYSLVTKDVEPYTIVGGVQAKVIRKRFDDRTIERLLEIQWWNWPIEFITENIKALLTTDIKFLEESSERLFNSTSKDKAE